MADRRRIGQDQEEVTYFTEVSFDDLEGATASSSNDDAKQGDQPEQNANMDLLASVAIARDGAEEQKAEADVANAARGDGPLIPISRWGVKSKYSKAIVNFFLRRVHLSGQDYNMRECCKRTVAVLKNSSLMFAVALVIIGVFYSAGGAVGSSAPSVPDSTVESRLPLATIYSCADGQFYKAFTPYQYCVSCQVSNDTMQPAAPVSHENCTFACDETMQSITSYFTFDIAKTVNDYHRNAYNCEYVDISPIINMTLLVVTVLTFVFFRLIKAKHSAKLTLISVAIYFTCGYEYTMVGLLVTAAYTFYKAHEDTAWRYADISSERFVKTMSALSHETKSLSDETYITKTPPQVVAFVSADGDRKGMGTFATWANCDGIVTVRHIPTQGTLVTSVRGAKIDFDENFEVGVIFDSISQTHKSYEVVIYVPCTKKATDWVRSNLGNALPTSLVVTGCHYFVPKAKFFGHRYNGFSIGQVHSNDGLLFHCTYDTEPGDSGCGVFRSAGAHKKILLCAVHVGATMLGDDPINVSNMLPPNPGFKEESDMHNTRSSMVHYTQDSDFDNEDLIARYGSNVMRFKQRGNQVLWDLQQRDFSMADNYATSSRMAEMYGGKRNRGYEKASLVESYRYEDYLDSSEIFGNLVMENEDITRENAQRYVKKKFTGLGTNRKLQIADSLHDAIMANVYDHHTYDGVEFIDGSYQPVIKSYGRRRDEHEEKDWSNFDHDDYMYYESSNHRGLRLNRRKPVTDDEVKVDPLDHPFAPASPRLDEPVTCVTSDSLAHANKVFRELSIVMNPPKLLTTNTKIHGFNVLAQLAITERAHIPMQVKVPEVCLNDYPELRDFVAPVEGSKGIATTWEYHGKERQFVKGLKGPAKQALTNLVKKQIYSGSDYKIGRYMCVSDMDLNQFKWQLSASIASWNINGRSSPGYPWKLLATSNRDIIDKHFSVLAFAVFRKLQALEAGSTTFGDAYGYCSVFVKKEFIPVHKLRQGRMRDIKQHALDDLLAAKWVIDAYLGTTKMFTREYPTQVGCDVATTAGANAVFKHGEEYRGDGFVLVSTDVSSWDWKFRPWQWEICFDAISQVGLDVNSRQPQHVQTCFANAVNGLKHAAINSVYLWPDGTVLTLKVPGIMNSGHLATSIFNSWSNIALNVHARMLVDRRVGIKRHHMPTFKGLVYGDDCVVSLPEQYVQHFPVFKQVYSELGFVLREMNIQPNSSFEFCSRVFMEDKSYLSRWQKNVFNLVNNVYKCLNCAEEDLVESQRDLHEQLKNFIANLYHSPHFSIADRVLLVSLASFDTPLESNGEGTAWVKNIYEKFKEEYKYAIENEAAKKDCELAKKSRKPTLRPQKSRRRKSQQTQRS